MSDESSNEDIRVLWRNQHIDTAPSLENIRTGIEEMERKMRRATYDIYIALALSGITVLAIAVWFANAILVTGAVLMLCSFVFLMYEVADHRRRAPSAADGVVTSLEYQRHLLQHRLEFHQRRLWLRTVILAPGGVLFFLGFAAARPDLAPFIYFQLATFAVAIILIVPANRRAAAKLDRQIEQLEQLR